MKIRINADLIGETFSNKIESKLSKAGLPTCIGNMSPPIINMEIPFEVEEILKKRSSVPSFEIAYESIYPIVVSNLDGVGSDLIIDNSGKLLIEARKESICAEYVDRIKKCSTCEHFTLCDRLTTHYLNTIKLSILSRITKG